MWKYTLRTLTIGGSICVRLTSCLTGLDKTEQVKLFLFNISKAAESKQNKQEVSCTEILPPLWFTFLLSSTYSLQRRHFLTRAEHWPQTVMWPQGRKRISRFWSEQTMHSSKHFSSSLMPPTPSDDSGTCDIKFWAWLQSGKRQLVLFC